MRLLLTSCKALYIIMLHRNTPCYNPSRKFIPMFIKHYERYLTYNAVCILQCIHIITYVCIYYMYMYMCIIYKQTTICGKKDICRFERLRKGWGEKKDSSQCTYNWTKIFFLLLHFVTVQILMSLAFLTACSDASSYHLHPGGSPSWQLGALTVNAAWSRAEKATCRLVRMLLSSSALPAGKCHWTRCLISYNYNNNKGGLLWDERQKNIIIMSGRIRKAPDTNAFYEASKETLV